MLFLFLLIHLDQAVKIAVEHILFALIQLAHLLEDDQIVVVIRSSFDHAVIVLSSEKEIKGYVKRICKRAERVQIRLGFALLVIAVALRGAAQLLCNIPLQKTVHTT